MTTSTCNIVMIDNLDSFTYNLVDEFQCLGFDPIVYRNTLSADFIESKIKQLEQETNKPVIIVLSPGPGDPSQAGCLLSLIEKTAHQYPLLGICLGHQALMQYFGGTVERAPEIVHGKSSNIVHSGTGVFKNISQPLPVARYHSLVVTNEPEMLEVTARYNNLTMAFEHKQHPIVGFQFHPESILTTYGSPLLAQTIEYLLSSKHN